MDGWFPKFWPDGEVISGSREPTPIDNEWYVWNGADQGLLATNRRTGETQVAWPEELIELAGGGGKWAGRDARRGGVQTSWGEFIPNAGQPSIDPDGNFTYRHGDDTVEPSICGKDVAWGDGRGRVYINGRDVTWEQGEARPRLTPDYMLTMTQTDLIKRHRVTGAAWRARLGENRNLHSSIRPDGFVVCCDGQGRLIVPEWEPYATAPQPLPNPDPEEDPPMPTTPDHSFVVQAVNRDHPDLLRANTHESAGLFTELAVLALHAIDPSWGHIQKPAGRNAYRGHAVDAIKYKKTGQVIDILTNAGDGPGLSRVTWQEKPSREDEPWMAPTMPQDDPGDTQVPDPTPTPCPDCQALLGRLESLERAFADFKDRVATNAARIDEILLDLQTRPAPKYVASVDVGRTLGHTHRVSVKIDPV